MLLVAFFTLVLPQIVAGIRATPQSDNQAKMREPGPELNAVKDLYKSLLSPETCPAETESEGISCATGVPLEMMAFVGSLLICETPLSTGMYGAVFLGMIVCGNPRCVQHYKTTPHFRRRVVVKYAFEGKEKWIEPEFENLKKLHEPDFQVYPEPIELLSILPDHLVGKAFMHRIRGENPRAERLTSVGFVMEFIPGRTLYEELELESLVPGNLSPIALQQHREMTACYIAQLALIHGFTGAKGLFHKDAHHENLMVVDGCQEFSLPVEGGEDIKCKRIKAIDAGVMRDEPKVLEAVQHILMRFIKSHKLAKNGQEWEAIFVNNQTTNAMLNIICKVFSPVKDAAMLGVSRFIFEIKDEDDYKHPDRHNNLMVLRAYMQRCLGIPIYVPSSGRSPLFT